MTDDYAKARAFLEGCNVALMEQRGNREARERMYEVLADLVAAGAIPQRALTALRALHGDAS